MNRVLFILLISVFCLNSSIAQESQYTYIQDRAFFDPTDLIGYNFVPAALEIREEAEDEFGPGVYTFGVTRNNLYVAGEEIAGVYSVNNINPTKYGYQLKLMNARDPTIQGHLKIILDKRARVEALIFRRSKTDKEIIFFQSPIPGELAQQEKEYFTDIYDTKLESTDSLWSKTIRPFFRIHKDAAGEQERLQIEDSTEISFIEEITVIDKTKKKKKKEERAEPNMENIELGIVEGEEVDPESEEEEETEAEALAADIGADPDEIAEEMEIEDEEKKKIKIVKEYFVQFKSIITYNDGTVENELKKYEIKKIKERTDEQAGPYDEKFQVEIETDKGGTVYLYLTPERTFSSIELGGKKFLMRGH